MLKVLKLNIVEKVDLEICRLLEDNIWKNQFITTTIRPFYDDTGVAKKRIATSTIVSHQDQLKSSEKLQNCRFSSELQQLVKKP